MDPLEDRRLAEMFDNIADAAEAITHASRQISGWTSVLKQRSDELHELSCKVAGAPIAVSTNRSADDRSVNTPLTAERFARMMHKDETPTPPRKASTPPPKKHLNYTNGKPLASQAQVDKRTSANIHALSMGYDYEHWCKMVYRVRTKVFCLNRKDFATLLGLTDAAVRHWEFGISFASLDSRMFLERVSAALHQIDDQSWKGSE